MVLGDGAPWIWNIAQELFPQAIQIVDRFHVKQHLSELSKVIYGAQSTQAKTCDQELNSGRFQDLLRPFAGTPIPTSPPASAFSYLHRNRDGCAIPNSKPQASALLPV